MKLTHVQMFDDLSNCYVDITIDEATKLFPHKVSAHSNIFLCSLCGGAVLLTDEGQVERHFRHAPIPGYESLDSDYYCQERTPYNKIEFKQPESYSSHVMPMLIKLQNGQCEIFLGFVCTKETYSYSRDANIVINSDFSEKVYNISRLKPGTTTYLSCGGRLSSKYTLRYDNIPSELAKLWPIELPSFAPLGTIFYKSSSNSSYYKRLYWGAQISITYLRESDLDGNSNLPREFLLIIDAKCAQSLRIQYNECYEIGKWLLYTFTIETLNKGYIQLFKQCGVELVDKVGIAYQFWPPKITNSHVVTNFYKTNSVNTIWLYHNSKHSQLGFYPSNTLAKEQQTINGCLYEIDITDREQMVISGINGAINFNYFNCTNIEPAEAAFPKIDITNNNGVMLCQDSYCFNSSWRYLQVTSPWQGLIKIYKEQRLINIITLNDNKPTLLNSNNLALGLHYEFYLGAHLIRTITLKDPKDLLDELLCKLLLLNNTPQQSIKHYLVIAKECKSLLTKPKLQNSSSSLGRVRKRTPSEQPSKDNSPNIDQLSNALEQAHKQIVSIKHKENRTIAQKQISRRKELSYEMRLVTRAMTLLKDCPKTYLCLKEQIAMKTISNQLLRDLIYFLST